MVEGSDVLELIFLGASAAFLIYRLFSVLGEKVGLEENPEKAAASSLWLQGEEEKVEETLFIPDIELKGKLQKDAEKLKSLDSSFTVRSFIEGATSAFEIVLDAYAKGDRGSLKSLLSRDLFEDFSNAIDEREAKKQTLSTTLVKIDEIAIEKISLRSKEAFISVRYVSEQTNLLKDAAGEIIEGSPNQIEEVTEVWTFSRTMTSGDPNWTLIETRT